MKLTDEQQIKTDVENARTRQCKKRRLCIARTSEYRRFEIIKKDDRKTRDIDPEIELCQRIDIGRDVKESEDGIGEPMSEKMTDVWTALDTLFESPLPTAFAITIFPPRAIPVKRFTARLVIGALAPTAAIELIPMSPVNLPTIAVSAALKSCWSMPVRARGIANLNILSHRLP